VHKELQELFKAPKEDKVPKVLKVTKEILVLLWDQQVHKARQVVVKELKGFKGHKEPKVLKGLIQEPKVRKVLAKVHKARQVIREHKGLKEIVV
jgi:hypothetical protein